MGAEVPPQRASPGQPFFWPMLRQTETRTLLDIANHTVSGHVLQRLRCSRSAALRRFYSYLILVATISADGGRLRADVDRLGREAEAQASRFELEQREMGDEHQRALDRAAAHFRDFDTNQDGVLDLGEFVEVMEKLTALSGTGYTDAQMRLMFEQVDLDGSGLIDFNEFLVAQHKRRKARGVLKSAALMAALTTLKSHRDRAAPRG